MNNIEKAAAASFLANLGKKYTTVNPSKIKSLRAGQASSREGKALKDLERQEQGITDAQLARGDLKGRYLRHHGDKDQIPVPVLAELMRYIRGK